MPPNAFVIIFEDDPDALEMTREYVENGNHTVIGEAASIESLEKLMHDLLDETSDKNHITEIQKGPVVALLDNEAPFNDGAQPESKGVGAVAERIIKEQIEHAITVATTSKDVKQVGYGDHRFFPNEGYDTLGRFIDSLPDKER